MIKIDRVVIVEGKYDKIRLTPILDAVIIETDGFGIFKDKEKQAMLRSIAEKRGLLILTDSDGAGFVIRNFLKGSVSPDKIKNAYIPDIFGKEKRKSQPSKEGKLGVEGISEEILCRAIANSGVECELNNSSKSQKELTKTDLFEYGLTGSQNASQNRDILKKALHLPENLTSNALLDILNCTMTKNEFDNICNELFRKE